MKAFVVVDLGFGDAGKGLMTDYLVRRHEAELVVRFNGGAQAGHNVVDPSGREHTFSQFGSGTFVPGVGTHLASPVVVHPTALRVEAARLDAVGEPDALRRVSVDPRCLVTTPFQQAANRLRERLRGGARHGSCGVGVGETVADALATPELAVRFGELLRPERLRDRLEAVREHKSAEFSARAGSAPDPDAARELALLSDPEVSERWLELATDVARTVRIVGDEAVTETRGPVVFEGAQGVLLDQDFGFHPFTTWSRCTPAGARELLSRIGWAHPVETIGVLRAYAVRHGPGPLPTEDALVVAKTTERHNHTGPWQGPVRKGWLDLALLSYAIRACGGVDALAVTHLDAVAALAPYRWCERYASRPMLELPGSLDEQAALTQQLFAAEPHYAAVSDATPEALCQKLAERAAVPVKYGSSGPSSGAIREAGAS
ncbi:MAG: adenylosuccinate synthetase [Myxococcales bacterium]